MELKLDTNALSALFPDGSEARLKLQQCVLEEFGRRQIKALDSVIRSQVAAIHAGAGQQIEETFKAAGWTKSYSSWKLPQALKEELAETAKNLVTTEASSMMREAVDRALAAAISRIEPSLQDKLDRAVDARIKTLLDTEADALIRKALRNRMQAMLDKGEGL